MTRSCHRVRSDLYAAAGEPDALPAAAASHVATCGPCAQSWSALRADARLLGRVLPMRAPAGPPPVIGSRPLPVLALAEGRSVPAWWLAVPAAAAAAVLLVAGVFTHPPSPDRPRVAGVRVEPLAGAEWDQVMGVLGERDASGPVGPLVDRVLDGVGVGGAPRDGSTGDEAEGR